MSRQPLPADSDQRAASWEAHDHPQSPCIKVCSLDRDGICLGCQRSIEEISSWPLLSAGQKRKVLENCGLRLRKEA